MSNIRNKIFYTLLWLFASVMSFAQSSINSPYSRLGLGDLGNQNYAFLNGMGNLSATMQDPYHVNLLNPASLSHLYATAFEVGTRVKHANLMSSTSEASVWSGSLAYLSLGFPVINPISEALSRRESKLDWGMNFALVPYSTVGYNVETTEMRQDIGQISSNFEGSGSTYKFLWGNGFNIKNVSFGGNLGYVFGKLSRDQEVDFDSLDGSYRDNFHDDLSLNGFVWNAGVQYNIQLKSSKNEKESVSRQIIIGLYGNSDMNIQSKGSQLYYRYNRFYNNLDTIRNIPVTTYPAKLPAEISGGVMYQKANKLRVGVNYSRSMWSNYENEAKPDELKDTYQVSLGGELIPVYNSYNSYFKKMRYRAGAFYGTDPRSDGFNKQLTSYGITLGLGFPIIIPRQTTSYIDIAFEFGKFGSDQALDENYINMTIGFTLNDDKWFIKRKFN